MNIINFNDTDAMIVDEDDPITNMVCIVYLAVSYIHTNLFLLH